ncbi:MAG: hypothetical protein CM1200mP29_06390 [Verrucomicrobiota bacterium]|nr:MAG: hypothetical protein CM1200mP29_06390 [Verrucomicrobiota bacterium]
MQHHGWLESYAQAAMPDKELVFRNHGFGGDKVNNRPRNKGFPSADSYLEISKADVILAFWGYNESFDDSADAYRADLAKWVDDTKGKKYNGENAPRIVLFSPIAHENLGQTNLPDGSANNARLAKYAEATRQVANEKGVEFVDLFGQSQELYARSKTPLTINGIHLTSRGNNQLARGIHKSLYGKSPRVSRRRLDRIRDAVLDKNWHWYNRYRATDGNDVWGGRSGLAFVNKQTNRVVLQHELKMIDVMTANRDKVIHAAANGKTVPADDSNVPPPVKVISNVGGGSPSSNANKEGTVKYDKPEETLAKLKLAPNMKANVFASEEMFDNMINPVQMGVDTKGRLWAAVWPTYPQMGTDQEWRQQEDAGRTRHPAGQKPGRRRGQDDHLRPRAQPDRVRVLEWGCDRGELPGPDLFQRHRRDDKADVKERMLQASTRPTRTTLLTISFMGQAVIFTTNEACSMSAM